MTRFKTIFNNRSVHPFVIIEHEDSEWIIHFTDDGLTYRLDLEIVDGVIDVEFGVIDDCNFDTTNLHRQYRILKIITSIIRFIITENDIYISTVSFRGSNLRRGKIDTRSGDIRNRFFIRHIIRELPNSIISIGKYNVIEVKLNDG